MQDPGHPFPADLAAELYLRADAGRWHLSRERFAEALGRASAQLVRSGDVDRAALDRCVTSLHLEDLALACACAEGQAPAWEHFMLEVQPRVRAAARAIAGTAGHDLADALVGDLYGNKTPGHERRSLFEYFHGRSRLTTWLRTVIAQRHVDELRRSRRTVPLNETQDRPVEAASREPPSGGMWSPAVGGRDVELGVALAADRSMVLAVFERELERAVGALSPSDRLRLSYYYVHKLTLAQIGGILKEHESSTSRKLERARRQLRDDVEGTLRREHGFGETDMRQCYEEASRHGTVEIAALLK